MKTTTPKQLKVIQTLLRQNNIVTEEHKRPLIASFTDGRTDSSRAMEIKEAEKLISHLVNLSPVEKSADKMRKKLLSMAHEVGWKIQGTDKISMKDVNAWCIKYGHKHKKLDDYKYEELPALITQFETMYKQYLSKV